jgi:hypothetical protein
MLNNPGSPPFNPFAFPSDGRLYAGDAPGNAPVVPDARMQMLAQNVYRGPLDVSGTAPWQNWIASLGQPPQQPAQPNPPPASNAPQQPQATTTRSASRPKPGQAGYSSAAAAQQQQNQQGGSITTGIGVNPVMGDPQINELRTRLMQFTVPAGLSGGQQGQFNDLSRQYGETSSLDFGRQASQANAQHLLGAQGARANAGLGWAGIQAQDELAATQQALSVLGSLGTVLDPTRWLADILAGFQS